MSRIGKKPIGLPEGIRCQIRDGKVCLESPKGRLTTDLPSGIRCEEKDQALVLRRMDDSRQQRAFHGLARSLVANAVQGLSEGFRKELDIIGIGYKVQVEGRKMIFQIGYSRPVEFLLPEGIEVKVERQTHLVLSGIDKQLVGQVAAEIRGLRPPEPYKGKGIRYRNEEIRRKAGKAGKAGAGA